jgi:hypothetical protein
MTVICLHAAFFEQLDTDRAEASASGQAIKAVFRKRGDSQRNGDNGEVRGADDDATCHPLSRIACANCFQSA